MKIRSELNLPKLSTIKTPSDSNEVFVAIDSNAKMVVKDSLGNEKILANNDDLNNKEDAITNLPVSKGGTGINDLTGQANKVLAVNSTSDGYEFVTQGGGEAGSLPVASVIALAYNSNIPTDLLECDGSAISRTTYSSLFAKVGTTYGAGDGSATFNIPDLRGEFIRGWDNGRGVDIGRSFGSHQLDEFKEHDHNLNTDVDHVMMYNQTGFGRAYANNGAANYVTQFEANGGDETRPRNIALMFCIKY